MSIVTSECEDLNIGANSPAAEKTRSASVEEVGTICTTQTTFSIQARCLLSLSNMLISFLNCTKMPADYADYAWAIMTIVRGKP